MGMLKNIDAKMQVNQDLVRQSAVNSDPVLPTYHLFQNIYQYAIVTLFDYCTTREFLPLMIISELLLPVLPVLSVRI